MTKKQLKKLRKASSLFVKDVFAIDLQNAIREKGLADYCTVTPDPNGEGDATYPEPRKVHVVYQSVFGNADIDYLQSEVLLEISARSLFEPTAKAKVRSLVSQNSTIDTTVADVDIIAAVPEKTFLEKAFLLHELFTTTGCRYANRKSRHLYDLMKMMDEPFAQKAVGDDELWNTIHHHRELFTSIKDVDYTPDIRKRIVPVTTGRSTESMAGGLRCHAGVHDIWGTSYIRATAVENRGVADPIPLNLILLWKQGSCS